ncbi:hypothetical protein LUZ61_002788 [Rhynchospora tenuis]|uniref:Glycosyltransferase 2-like domain-containing protein n=1 Tax=Rhynchospora tenuis TaxID=198213 RepID=A0AAD5ZJQ2_9POAL|nr:hypothetical protein LUZ61_002788 [Rhynchospora tenuis]
MGWFLVGKETRRGTPVVVTMENPNYSIIEINGPGTGSSNSNKDHSKNAKQFTWVLLLRASGFLGCFATFLYSFPRIIKKRLSIKTKPTGKGSILFKFIRGFLLLCLATLGFELVGYVNGWHLPHFQNPNMHIPEIRGWLHYAYLSWVSFRANYVAYPIQLASNVCVILFVIQSVDRLVQCLGWFWIKLKDIKPTIENNPFEEKDAARTGTGPVYPMVLVQIPMCNEREVYEQSISAVCKLDWPKDRLLIQVLDDSDDDSIMSLIKSEVSKWCEQGVNIIYRHRLVRKGYKAGNLKSAMSCDYVRNYEFVTIFDADFQPSPDFLKRTIPHFMGNPDLGLVQARWSFINKDENLLTRLQYINMCFHFEVEQQVNGVFLNFFGFNGTAGVWRIKALEDSGGWLERTTVEDMDIAVRAHVNGWKFIFLNDVKVLCEVPESYEAYRKQQHRWHSGPMHLFRLCLPSMINSKLPIWKKANLILLFFLLRKLILPLYSFILFCIILPLTMFVPEAELPVWVICYVPVILSVLNVFPAPKYFPFVIPYLLFENTMSVTKFNAMLSGLLQLGSSYEWIVTKKAGRSSEAAQTEKRAMKDDNSKDLTKGDTLKVTKMNKIYKKELALALLLLIAAIRSLLSARGIHFYFLLFQGAAFLLVGLDLIGEQIS